MIDIDNIMRYDILKLTNMKGVIYMRINIKRYSNGMRFLHGLVCKREFVLDRKTKGVQKAHEETYALVLFLTEKYSRKDIVK